jgi:two-component system, OmpR family, response regulator
MKALVVDADAPARDLLSEALQRGGYAVTAVADGRAVLACAAADRFDVVLLESSLPGMSGLEVCRRLRARGGTPIIVVSARDSEHDVIRALESGADAFVSKPFSPRELLARIRAVLRRTAHAPAAALSRPDAERGRVLLVPSACRVHVSDAAPVQLTRLEFRILQRLTLEPNQVVPYPTLMRFAYNADPDDGPRSAELLKPHVSRLRAKLARCLGLDVRILSVPSLGYKVAIDHERIRRLEIDHSAMLTG